MDLSQYIGLFVDESKEHLQQLNDKLLELEHQPDNKDILNEIFRIAHTIKGMAATLVEFPYFQEIATLTHEMENLMENLRSGSQMVTPKIVDILFSCLDSLDVLVDNVSDPDNASKVEYDKLLGDIKGAMSMQEAAAEAKAVKEQELVQQQIEAEEEVETYREVDWEEKYSQDESKSIAEAAKDNKNCYEIHITFMSNCQMKSVRAMLVMRELEVFGNILKTFPSQEEIAAEKIGDKFSATVITDSPDKPIKDAVLSVNEIEKVDMFNLLGETTRTLESKEDIQESDEEEHSEFIIPDFNEYERLLINEAHKQGLNTVVLGIHLFSGVLLKATRVTVILRALENVGEIIKTLPSISDLEEERFGSFFQVALITKDSREKVVNILLSIAEVRDSVDIASVSVDEHAELHAVDEKTGTVIKGSGTAAAAAEKEKEQDRPKEIKPLIHDADFEEDYDLIDDDSDSGRFELMSSPPPRASSRSASSPNYDDIIDASTSPRSKKAVSSGVMQPANRASSKKKAQIVRVDTDKLDQLMTLVGELVIKRATLSAISGNLKLPQMSQAVSELSSVASDLQEVTMKLRMVPVEQVFNRFPRMVRDLAKTLNKDIDFLVEGADTELDRTLIDDIGDPLVHLIRNSADHGLETPEERQKMGKSRKGKILLKARYDGHNVEIMVKDDGRGIDVRRLKKKAVEKGLISAKQALMMDEKQALQIIFHSGFSTAEKTTDISGRGVGMDAVRVKIESIGGRIELSSTPGQGTETLIKLPLTLAILKTLLTRIGQEVYAIPLITVEEVTEVLNQNIQTIQNCEVSVIRGETIPVINLSEILSVPEHTHDHRNYDFQGSPMVVVRIGDRKCGLIVDDLIGQDEIVIKPLSRTLHASDYISGAATLGNGEIALILNTSALMN